jgi:hypothetical protein
MLASGFRLSFGSLGTNFFFGPHIFPPVKKALHRFATPVTVTLLGAAFSAPLDAQSLDGLWG